MAIKNPTGKATFRWYGAQVKKDIRDEMKRRVVRIGAWLEGEMKQLVSQQYTRVAGPSKPGEPPHRNLGGLTRSITHIVAPSKLYVDVGTSIKYGIFLELGTSKMEPRPFIRTTLMKHRMKIIAILSKPIRGVGVRGRLITP